MARSMLPNLFAGQRVFLALNLMAALLLPAEVNAEVVADGSVGPVFALNAADMRVLSDYGRQSGTNLFHSFRVFDIAAGQRVTFSGPTSIANIVSRVTGGNASSIDGVIAADIPGAAMYFINPAGVVFGANAKLETQGSFYASTADMLRFADGATLHASLASDSQFSSAAPAAFGFLAGNAASLSANAAVLEVMPGNTLALVSRDIGLTDGALLYAPAGRIDLGDFEADASNGVITLSDSRLYTGSIENQPSGSIRIVGGQLTLTRSALLNDNAADSAGGDIDIQASGTVTLGEDSLIYTHTEGNGNAGNINLQAGRLDVVSGSALLTVNEGMANTAGGHVSITTRGGVLVDGINPVSDERSMISTLTSGSGQAGGIAVHGETIAITNGAWVGSNTLGLSIGAAGAVELGADVAVVVAGADASPNYGQPSQLYSTTFGTGAAGGIVIEAPDVSITGGGNIHSITTRIEPGAGRGGRIVINASGSLRVDGQSWTGSGPSIVQSSSYGSGAAGSIEIHAGSVEVSQGGSIASDTFDDSANAGAGGAIHIDAVDTIRISGSAPVLAYPDSVLASAIDAATRGPGRAGSIELQARRVEVLDGGQVLSTTSSEVVSGLGGDIHVQASEVVLDRSNGELTLMGVDTFGAAAAGTLSINTGTLEVRNGASISSSSIGSQQNAGAAGKVRIQASDSVRIHGLSSNGLPATITSTSYGPGAAGDIDIQARQVGVERGGWISATAAGSEAGSGNGGAIGIRAEGEVRVQGVGDTGISSRIDSSSSGSGAAGVINISAGALSILDGGQITTDTWDTSPVAGAGGNIAIQVEDLRVVGRDVGSGRGSMLTSSTAGSGAAGHIEIDAAKVEVTDAAWIKSSSLGVLADSGPGGNIRVHAQSIRLANASYIYAGSSGPGNAGAITLEATDSILLEHGTSVYTGTAQSDGGDIHLGAGSFIELVDSGILTSVEGGAGNGGNISLVDSTFVVLNDSAIAANAFGGDGGNIDIVTDYLVATPISRIEASSQLGIDGRIEVTSPPIDLGSGLAAPSIGLVDVSLMLRETCPSQARRGRLNTFSAGGRGGLPLHPESWTPTDYSGLFGSNRSSSSGQPVVRQSHFSLLSICRSN